MGIPGRENSMCESMWDEKSLSWTRTWKEPTVTGPSELRFCKKDRETGKGQII